MAYEPQEWADGPEGETPITAAALNRIEQGIADAAEAADEAAFPSQSQWDSLVQRVSDLEDALGD